MNFSGRGPREHEASRQLRRRRWEDAEAEAAWVWSSKRGRPEAAKCLVAPPGTLEQETAGQAEAVALRLGTLEEGARGLVAEEGLYSERCGAW